jgi:hypothetical protein
MELVAHPVNETVVEGQTYDYYIKSNRTDSTKRVFAPYDEASIKADFWSLWRTGFLDNLWIEVIDEPYANGVEGKHVIFHIEDARASKPSTTCRARDQDPGRDVEDRGPAQREERPREPRFIR